MSIDKTSPIALLEWARGCVPYLSDCHKAICDYLDGDHQPDEMPDDVATVLRLYAQRTKLMPGYIIGRNGEKYWRTDVDPAPIIKRLWEAPKRESVAVAAIDKRIATYRAKHTNENPPEDTAYALRFAIEALEGLKLDIEQQG